MARKKESANQPIVTTEDGLVKICPACASPDLGKIDYYGRVTLTCQACGWTERYQLPPAVRL